MEILVDDALIDSRTIEGGTLEQVLQHIQSDVCPPGRLVVGLRCDGKDVPSGAMSATLEEPVAKFERLEVITSTRCLLVSEAMTQAEECLEQTAATCERVAELLNEGNSDEAVSALGECLGVWQQLHEAVGKSITMLDLDADTVTIDGVALAEVIDKPKDVLGQIKQALVARDYVLLADILQYEFGEVIDRWRALAAKLREEAAALDRAESD